MTLFIKHVDSNITSGLYFMKRQWLFPLCLGRINLTISQAKYFALKRSRDDCIFI